MYLLDTNVISELRKANTCKIDQHVESWAKSVSASQLFISAITVLEIETGILSVGRKDSAQEAVLRKWFEAHVLPTFVDRTISFDAIIARRCAQLHVPDRRSERDAMIAATALVHGMVLVTRNTKDFESLNIDIINPWNRQK